MMCSRFGKTSVVRRNIILPTWTSSNERKWPGAPCCRIAPVLAHLETLLCSCLSWDFVEGMTFPESSNLDLVSFLSLKNHMNYKVIDQPIIDNNLSILLINLTTIYLSIIHISIIYIDSYYLSAINFNHPSIMSRL